ncbi:prolyl aminopeptidase [Amycolatopsis sp. PS_44_ISF1]|uniref:prolyl aminopeptidase n=1 Tax=Amycolatopsis sp. PS_44_ISF1 TaxID=2974917 RepID=UPI0028DE1ABE|nr:prolyl aminopeptidase [Amycolatopsis sp. PS_44_ISF1]MDT8912862.1 prolyl aminopeptidase [Amycolatopsis sp. PS_44_ISF1]
MTSPFPLPEPYDHGLLDVGDGQRIYWETSGNPDGKPVVVVHGGPGGGGKRASRKTFDPQKFRIVLFDQRGCGESRPHAGDPSVGLEHNTTEHLLADLEKLREHLGIEKWMMYGGSWGPTLMLAYAERHPERVTELVMVAAGTSGPDEIDWLYRGLGRLLPAEWAAFRDAVPEAERDGDLLAAYGRLLESPDEQVRLRAARDWCAWEDAVIAHEAQGKPGQYSAKEGAELVAFVRIAAHYFGHAAWLEPGAILRDVHRLHGIPAVFVQGRLDLSVPLKTAWELSRAWPEAELVVIDDSGHTGSPAMGEAIMSAVARFAAR